MDCMAEVRTSEAAGVAWSTMPWTVTSVEQQTSGQDEGKPATHRLGGRGADVLTSPARYLHLQCSAVLFAFHW